MTSQSWKQTVTIHILSSISRIKANQTMKFGQLLECNMKNIFLEKLKIKCGGQLFPDHIFKTQNWAYNWTSGLKFYTICFTALICVL